MRRISPIVFFCVVALILIIALLPVIAPHILAKLRQTKYAVTTAIANSSSPSTTPNQSAEQVGPLISRGAPAFASSEDYPASYANDASYDTSWESNGAPAWLAYDLSAVPVGRRQKVLLVWYNETGNYDHTIIQYPAYNLPQNYTIEVNAARGGEVPTAGWVTQVKVQGNHYHSRQHVIDMAGYNWIRINITSIDGSEGNYDAAMNMDIYDAAPALADDWIIFGSSSTDGGMGHLTIDGTPAFADLIHEKEPGMYPVQENGGIGYLTSADGAKYLNTWLSLFPGKYVGLSYGANDALGCSNPDDFYRNYEEMVQDILRIHKVPVVSLIPWGRDPNMQNCVPPLNAKLAELYQAFPQIIRGPDFWTFFIKRQSLISSDNIHPGDAGFAAYRQLWANAMLAEVYGKHSTS